MHNIRIALGADAPRLQRILGMLDLDDLVSIRNFTRNYPGQLVLIMDKSDPVNLYYALNISEGELLLTEGELYLIDPLGNLIMFYSTGTNPGDILKDLQRLLRYSRIG